MRITTKGQVTIPSHIRELLGLRPYAEVEFKQEGERVYIEKRTGKKTVKRFRKYRGVAKVKMTTDEIMALTRDYS